MLLKLLAVKKVQVKIQIPHMVGCKSHHHEVKT